MFSRLPEDYAQIFLIFQAWLVYSILATLICLSVLHWYVKRCILWANSLELSYAGPLLKYYAKQLGDVHQTIDQQIAAIEMARNVPILWNSITDFFFLPRCSIWNTNNYICHVLRKNNEAINLLNGNVSFEATGNQVWSDLYQDWIPQTIYVPVGDRPEGLSRSRRVMGRRMVASGMAPMAVVLMLYSLGVPMVSASFNATTQCVVPAITATDLWLHSFGMMIVSWVVIALVVFVIYRRGARKWKTVKSSGVDYVLCAILVVFFVRAMKRTWNYFRKGPEAEKQSAFTQKISTSGQVFIDFMMAGIFLANGAKAAKTLNEALGWVSNSLVPKVTMASSGMELLQEGDKQSLSVGYMTELKNCISELSSKAKAPEQEIREMDDDCKAGNCSCLVTPGCNCGHSSVTRQLYLDPDCHNDKCTFNSWSKSWNKLTNTPASELDPIWKDDEGRSQLTDLRTYAKKNKQLITIFCVVLCIGTWAMYRYCKSVQRKERWAYLNEVPLPPVPTKQSAIPVVDLPLPPVPKEVKQCCHSVACPMKLPIDAMIDCHQSCGGHHCTHWAGCQPVQKQSDDKRLRKEEQMRQLQGKDVDGNLGYNKRGAVQMMTDYEKEEYDNYWSAQNEAHRDERHMEQLEEERERRAWREEREEGGYGKAAKKAHALGEARDVYMKAHKVFGSKHAAVLPINQTGLKQAKAPKLDSKMVRSIYAERVCFNCDQKGHNIMTCPKQLDQTKIFLERLKRNPDAKPFVKQQVRPAKQNSYSTEIAKQASDVLSGKQTNQFSVGVAMKVVGVCRTVAGKWCNYVFARNGYFVPKHLWGIETYDEDTSDVEFTHAGGFAQYEKSKGKVVTNDMVYIPFTSKGLTPPGAQFATPTIGMKVCIVSFAKFEDHPQGKIVVAEGTVGAVCLEEGREMATYDVETTVGQSGGAVINRFGHVVGFHSQVGGFVPVTPKMLSNIGGSKN